MGDVAFDPSQFLILVVDDVLTNLQVVGSILDGAGYETAFATSGQAALKQITVTLPDLILLDLMMPGLDGLDTCTCLRSNPAYASIPIIFLTASNEKTHLLSAFQRGAADYVTKPFNPLELLARVRIHLELKHTRDRLATTLTTLQQAFQDLQELATTDPLTGLGNRRRFFDLAEMTLRRVERYGGVFGIILLDLDHFKAVNDTYGHATGDEVLKALGKLIPDLMRQSDCCCRFGGEEFVILLPETGLHETLMVAERLRQAVEHLEIPVLGQTTHSAAQSSVAQSPVAQSPVAQSPAIVRPTMSAGVAIYRRTDMEVDDVVNRADTALYVAKAHGRNRVTSAIAPPPL
jgi:diguanylate cyclase (GGDEF)-like protein